jgi:hypothetical protein
MEREGDPKPFGLGAIRCFRFGPLAAKEEVVLWEPPRRYGYTVGWISLRGYRAEVTLEPRDGGTVISWCGRFERSTVPGLSRPFLWFIRTALARIARNLARHAERGVVRTD